MRVSEPQLVVGAIVVDDLMVPTRVLAARRSTPPAGAWEFPGGKVERQESPREALRRELWEELGVEVTIGAELMAEGGIWPISEKYVMRLYFAEVAQGEPKQGDSHDALTWLRAGDLESVEWLASDAAAVGSLKARLLQI